MSHVYRTINRYHRDFHSFRGIVTFKSPWVWLSLAALLGMGYSFFVYFAANLWPTFGLRRSAWLVAAIGCEVVALACWLRLQILRDDAVIKRCQERFNTDEKNLNRLKAVWFAKTLAVERTEYLEIAEAIDKLAAFRRRHKSSLSLSGKQVLELVFSSESKNRVLAMFMGVCAVTTALSIAGGATINSLFDFFAGTSFWQLVGLAGIFALLLLLTYLVLRYLVLLLLAGVEVIFDKDINSPSAARESEFINQLLLLHHLERARVKSN